MPDPRRFVGDIEVVLTSRYEHGRRIVRFLRQVDYEDAKTGLKASIYVGSETDWTSSPWWSWWLIPAFDQAAEASALHDSLLRLREVLINGLQVHISRAQVDRIHREALRCLGIPQWRRNLHWLAVRYQAWRRGDL